MKIVLELRNEQSFILEWFILESESTDTIGHIKATMHSISHIPPEYQTIMYDGRRLELGRTLADYSVKEGGLFSVLPPLSGGGPGEIERPRGKKKGEHESYNIYNIYYGDAFQLGWRDEHDKEFLQLLLKDGTISGGNITDKAWLRIQNGLNNSQNCNFQIDFLKGRLRQYNQMYSLLLETSSMFHWDPANNFILVKSAEPDYEMPLSGAQLSYLKCLQMLVHQDISQLSKIRAKFRKFRKCLTRLLTCSKTG